MFRNDFADPEGSGACHSGRMGTNQIIEQRDGHHIGRVHTFEQVHAQGTRPIGNTNQGSLT